MIRIILILTVAILGGCSAHKMAECRGPIFPMNAGQWQPTPEQLK